MGADVCSARPCIISHLQLPRGLSPRSPRRPTTDLHPCAGARLLTNGLQKKSKESPVRVRQPRITVTHCLWHVAKTGLAAECGFHRETHKEREM